MDELDEKKALLRTYRNQLTIKKSEKQSYLDTAADIGEVYQRMADDKAIVKGYRDSVKSFLRENYNTFTGDLYSESYKAKLNEVVQEYEVVIKNIDTNLDQLNLARAQYENKAYSCNGKIGQLQAAINSLIHTIQNWVN